MKDANIILCSLWNKFNNKLSKYANHIFLLTIKIHSNSQNNLLEP